MLYVSTTNNLEKHLKKVIQREKEKKSKDAAPSRPITRSKTLLTPPPLPSHNPFTNESRATFDFKSIGITPTITCNSNFLSFWYELEPASAFIIHRATIRWILVHSLQSTEGCWFLRSRWR
ncbi:hypothetical protein VNO80_04789 [Phaseolus coccineus]|uniref:Uncharacterized protein n=1 Tax=Phaseolus coccineus TaxID=3886 RepID=A0AAN9NUD4_PHACN